MRSGPVPRKVRFLQQRRQRTFRPIQYAVANTRHSSALLMSRLSSVLFVALILPGASVH